MIAPRESLKQVERSRDQEPSRMFKYRLDRNERNQPFSEQFIEKITSKITGELFMVYPELDEVYDKVAGWLGVSTDQLMLHSGSDQAIKAVFETYIHPGDRVLLHFPGYAMYDVYGKMFQAAVVGQYFDENLDFDWEAYGKQITHPLRMVVVENPNGFVGVAPSRNQLASLIQQAHATGSIVLVDEAYYHFHEETALRLVEKYDNIIITRSFSKAPGLAGLRGGYLISQPENIDYLKKVRPVYEITAVTAMVISELIDNVEELRLYVEETRRNLESLRQGLAKLGIATSDSKANFVAARLGEGSIHQELRSVLQKQGILIRRPFREESLKEWIRISTAPQQIQAILLADLSKILGRRAAL
jgi:histidinol-phosphate aminotransferase